MASYIPQLGFFIDENDTLANKDAIHIAVLPVFAGESLKAGDRVTLKIKKVDVGTLDEYISEDDYEEFVDEYDEVYFVYKSDSDIIGIVDPFLQSEAIPNSRIWLLLLPNTVENLRHDWNHKLIPNNFDEGYNKGYNIGANEERCPC